MSPQPKGKKEIKIFKAKAGNLTIKSTTFCFSYLPYIKGLNKTS